MRPLCIDLFCGLGGWTEGFLAEGYQVIGFDIEAHDYGDGKRYPAQLVIQDVLTIHGSQFKDAAIIVASPPCQEFSYMAMPWSRAKAIAAEYRIGKRDVKKLTALFNACFRIQREAIEAAGHFIPMVVENVRGAQPWVGRARWNFGSYYLWGDVPALMPITMPRRNSKPDHVKAGDRNPNGTGWTHSFTDTLGQKVPGFRFDGSGRSFQTAAVKSEGFKTQGMNWSNRDLKGQDFTRIAANQANGLKTVGHVNQRNGHTHTRHLTNQAESDGVKNGNDWFGSGSDCSIQRCAGSKSSARKAASATIAKIPLPLSRWIAKVYKPKSTRAVIP